MSKGYYIQKLRFSRMSKPKRAVFLAYLKLKE